MRKALLLAAAMIIITSLFGCSYIDGFLENQIQDKSGINENSDYLQYKTYSEQGNLDKDGYYIEKEIAAEDTTELSFAKITFAENAYLTAEYYTDADLSIPLNTKDAVFDEGDCIYATVSVNKSASNTAYIFSGFRLIEIDEDGERNELETIVPGEDCLILQLTQAYAGKELSLMPVGKYQNLEISLKDTFFDDNEVEHKLSGKWILDNEQIYGNTAEISPFSSHKISYEFDINKYFYVSSEPECISCNNEDGIVIFKLRESSDETVNYSVKLHQYISVNLYSSQSRSIWVNSGDEQKIKSKTNYEINQLKYGDTFTIETDKEWSELENTEDLKLLAIEKPTESFPKYKYTLTLPQNGGGFEFNPEDYTYEHGTLTFICSGEEVTSVRYLAQGDEIMYEQCSADEGYWLPDDEHKITVSTSEETKKALESISFAEKIQVSVKLLQPKYGGSIEYYADGNRINSDVYTCDSGTKLTMNFYPWIGWVSNYQNGTEYITTQSLTQTVQIFGCDVSTNAFNESLEHKPTLTVILDKSVGTDMQFALEASGYSKTAIKYEDNKGKSITEQSIGTEKGITLTMEKYAIKRDAAIKISVEMNGEDKSENKTKKVHKSTYRLVDNITDLQTPIDIYDSAEMGNSYIWYDSVKITVSVVDVKKFSQPDNPKNGTVTVRTHDNSTVLSDGDILDTSENVTITISADEGYFVDGKNVKNDIYQKTVKFDKYISDLNSIIDEHPIVKYCTVELESNDAYGSCVYKYGGEKVSGTIYVKPGDEITLEYTITTPNYIIDGEKGFLWTDIGKGKQSVKKIIDVTDDGKKLTREFFGIKVKKEA